jgi:hypothetical protein
MMESREWGWMKKFEFRSLFWIKFIHVNDEEMTSLQYHKWRSELHLSLRGIKYIAPFALHRMTAGNYIEIAWGAVNESDIIRINDKYGRK